MPILELQTLSAELSRSFSEQSYPWNLSLKVKLSDEDELRLSTGEVIHSLSKHDVKIYLGFHALTMAPQIFTKFKGEPKTKNIIGMMKYYPAREDDSESHPSAIFFEQYLAEAELNQLVEFAKQGRFPSKLHIELFSELGLKYGWEPDGRGKEWDTKTNPLIPIERIEWRLSVGELIGESSRVDKDSPQSDASLVPLLEKVVFQQRAILLCVLSLFLLFVYQHWR